MKRNLVILFTSFVITVCAQAQTVINPKGTITPIDSSKWTLAGSNIYNKNSGNIGIGTNTPASNLTLYQSNTGALSNRGFRFTGNSIGGTSSGTGFLFSLGYNQNNNKQIWLGDPDGAGINSWSFMRIQIAGSGNFPTLDAVSGDNAARRKLTIGNSTDLNSGLIVTPEMDLTSGNTGSYLSLLNVLAANNTTAGNATMMRLGQSENAKNAGEVRFVYQGNGNDNNRLDLGFNGVTAPVMSVMARGNVGIGTSEPNSSAAVEVASTTRGFLPPRMTSAQRDAISAPANGLVVYDVTTNSLWVYESSLWVQLISGAPTISTKTANYTLTADDNGSIFEFNSASGVTLTVPTGLPAGFQCSITQLGLGNVTVTGSGITVKNAYNFTKSAAQYSKIGIEITSTGIAILSGDAQ